MNIKYLSRAARRMVFLLLVALPVLGVFVGRISEVLLPLVVLFIGFETLFEKRLQSEIQALFMRLKSPFALAFIALLVWTFIACFWSHNVKMSLFHNVQLIGQLLCCFILIAYLQRFPFPDLAAKMRLSLTIAGVLLVITILVLTYFPSNLYKIYANLSPFNRAASAFWLLLWPLLYAASPRFKASNAVMLASLMLVTFISISSSAVLAALVAVLVFSLAYFLPRFTFHGMMGASLAMLLTMPFLAQLPFKIVNLLPSAVKLGQSSWHRIFIWDNFATLVKAYPLLGWGFDGSRHILDYPITQSLTLNKPEVNIGMHPHMQELQIWVELGAIGAVLAAFVWLFLWLKLTQIDNDKLRYITCFMAVTIAIATVNFSLWQGWWIAYLGITIALFGLPKEAK